MKEKKILDISIFGRVEPRLNSENEFDFDLMEWEVFINNKNVFIPDSTVEIFLKNAFLNSLTTDEIKSFLTYADVSDLSEYDSITVNEQFEFSLRN